PPQQPLPAAESVAKQSTMQRSAAGTSTRSMGG
ncbi:hypothetical protein LTSEJOH_4578, partial [Salmonella enterica subsp. enterica serovar Johannesburg str. S5-703]